MAVYICPDCGGKVSEHAKACPTCGCPIEYIIDNTQESDFDESDFYFKCDECGYISRSSDLVCFECGKPLTDLTKDEDYCSSLDIYQFRKHDNVSDFHSWGSNYEEGLDLYNKAHAPGLIEKDLRTVLNLLAKSSDLGFRFASRDLGSVLYMRGRYDLAEQYLELAYKDGIFEIADIYGYSKLIKLNEYVPDDGGGYSSEDREFNEMLEERQAEEIRSIFEEGYHRGFISCAYHYATMLTLYGKKDFKQRREILESIAPLKNSQFSLLAMKELTMSYISTDLDKATKYALESSRGGLYVYDYVAEKLPKEQRELVVQRNCLYEKEQMKRMQWIEKNRK